MKKYLAAMTALAVLAMAFAGCSSSEEGSNAPVVINEETGSSAADPDNADAASEADSQAEEDAAVTGDDMYTCVYEGVSIVMNTPAASILEALGDDHTDTSAPSCAYQGMDYSYTYDHVILRAYTDDVEDDDPVICGVEFRDDTVFTAEGISIGSAREDVVAAYGDADTEADGGLVYDNGTTSVTFFLEDGIVVGISYTLDQE